MSYNKLDGGITDSTVWFEPDPTRITWITMLAMCDQHGYVGASIPGLAGRARVSVDDCLRALECFMAPDPYSRTQDFEGRRIAEADGGWVLLNHAKYRAKQSEDDRKERARLAMAELRANRKQQELTDANSSQKLAELAHADADADIKDQKPSSSAKAEDPTPAKNHDLKTRLATVTSEAIQTFNASPLVKANGGMLASISPKVGKEKRQCQVSRCLRTARQICEEAYGSPLITAAFWADYWGEIARDDFHAGRIAGGKGHENWKPDFEFLTREATMLKVYDRTAGEVAA